ncbi:hypothetical protein QBC37DRAFT_464847 [Rhypophila decipiens]|uniref:Uncharacterized protein n=1 Tax=Rhypophila decipiens TaxID=261697 RepID=A0AAN6Y695_9PEZI|nr:hypothetical protein QBC37DRAFT_464847 [Rhypophila decipiens]
MRWMLSSSFAVADSSIKMNQYQGRLQVETYFLVLVGQRRVTTERWEGLGANTNPHSLAPSLLVRTYPCSLPRLEVQQLPSVIRPQRAGMDSCCTPTPTFGRGGWSWRLETRTLPASLCVGIVTPQSDAGFLHPRALAWHFNHFQQAFLGGSEQHNSGSWRIHHKRQHREKTLSVGSERAHPDVQALSPGLPLGGAANIEVEVEKREK